MNGMNVKAPQPEENRHLTPQSLTSWFTGSLSDHERRQIRLHCIECDDCRERLVLVMQSLQAEEIVDHDPEFSRLLRAAELAAEKRLRSSPLETSPLPEHPAGWRQVLNGLLTPRWIVRILIILGLLALVVWFSRK